MVQKMETTDTSAQAPPVTSYDSQSYTYQGKSPSTKVTATPTPSHSTSTISSSLSPPPFQKQSQLYPLDETSPATLTPLVPSTFSNSTSARVKETIARANSVPMEFYQTEFLEYSKETYERKMDAKRNKRKRSIPQQDDLDDTKRHKIADFDDADLVDEDDIESLAKSNELRRQIHIQSEQRRRAQIKDGFDELRKHLPGCSNKKMSKAALLTRTVQQIQHLKSTQSELLAEVERLVQENEALKKFQHGVLQRQAMEKMYNF
ncbi:hypothetical protein DM01DRAFT_262942 [Hesseltinella vesiculosa]|uniref:BHLH domain-containing protein n=1 Tax=Hesseltinella vesiculosa TaxID=101127 RepID=A0A1X2GRR3_9FUNG|nr:hypothetical protein DM01DRAFT_262942 [Hesseltinella vesiculosa]